MSEKVPAVLFLCTHNAGRSQMAAGYLRHWGEDRVLVLSAGSSPGEKVNPVAVEAMKEQGIDIGGAQPQKWTREMVEQVDVVVSMVRAYMTSDLRLYRLHESAARKRIHVN